MMKLVLAVLLSGGCLAAFGAAADSVSNLRVLGNAELDGVTAGQVGAEVDTVAQATGALAVTATQTGAIALKNEGPADSIFGTGSAAGGSASGAASGGPSRSLATGVAATSTAEGKQVNSGGFGWTLSGNLVQISAGVSYAVGSTAWEW
jgi:hypothetical protein